MSTLAPPAIPRPATPPVVDVATIAHLDADWAIACDVTDLKPCTASAAWWVHCRRCGTAYAECHLHRVAEAARWASDDPYIGLACNCGAHVRPRVRWPELFTITPIGGRP